VFRARHADVGREARRGPDITPPTDRNDITDPADAADSSDSTEKDDPTLNADAKEPIDPTERAEPTEPMDRTDPRDPIDRKESCDHRDHFDDGFMRAIFHAGRSSAHRALHPITPGRWVAAKAPATRARPVAVASSAAAA
jgi:hypothetical protein